MASGLPRAVCGIATRARGWAPVMFVVKQMALDPVPVIVRLVARGTGGTRRGAGRDWRADLHRRTAPCVPVLLEIVPIFQGADARAAGRAGEMTRGYPRASPCAFVHEFVPERMTMVPRPLGCEPCRSSQQRHEQRSCRDRSWPHIAPPGSQTFKRDARASWARIRSGWKDAAGSAGRAQLTFAIIDVRLARRLRAACLRTAGRCMEVSVNKTVKKLPARPNLDHLRGQAKTRLTQLKKRDPKARLADAQFAIARDTGFPSWPALVHHVEELRALEGEWQFSSLEVDGRAVPKTMLGQSRILIDGDHFRTESPDATYEGVFTIDADAKPSRIDIEFVEGPDAGDWSYGIYEHDGDSLTFCLGLPGAPRPEKFATAAGSGHALERLRRASSTRPVNVTGGTRAAAAAPPNADREDPGAFDVPMTPLLRRLEGEWIPVQLVMDGKPMPEQWLAFGSRTANGNEMKVVFGGQTMVHAKLRVDESVNPLAVDYLNLLPRQAGVVSRGIMEWIGDEVRFLIAPAGQPRPTRFTDTPATGTLSRWRRRI